MPTFRVDKIGSDFLYIALSVKYSYLADGTKLTATDKDSPLAAGAQQGLMNDLVRQAQGEFIMGSLEYGSSAMQFAGDAIATTGYAFSASGIGAAAGAPLIAAGNAIKNIGTTIDVGLDILSGNYRRAIYNGVANITMFGVSQLGNYVSEPIKAMYNLLLIPYDKTLNYMGNRIKR